MTDPFPPLTHTIIALANGTGLVLLVTDENHRLAVAALEANKMAHFFSLDDGNVFTINPGAYFFIRRTTERQAEEHKARNKLVTASGMGAG